MKKRSASGTHLKRRHTQERKKKPKQLMLENAEFLSKEQLKNVIKHPRSNMQPSGKRKHKVLKRLRHNQKEKSVMEVDTTPRPSTSQAKDKSTPEKPADMDTDSDSDIDDDEILADKTD